MKTYAVEPLDLMQHINRRFHEPVIHCRIVLDRPIDAGRLAKAIGRLRNLFPLLGCTYNAERNQFVEREGWEPSDVLHSSTEGDALLFCRLDSSRELVRFTLCGDGLYITISHLLCDGAGFRQLLYMLCDLYNSMMPEVPSTNRAFEQLLAGLSRCDRTLMTARMLASMLGGYRSFPIVEASDEQGDYLVERTIDAETMNAIHSMANPQGATLNDVFLAAYARAIHSLTGHTQLSIPCTSDLRKYTTAPTGIGNLTGSYTCNIHLHDGEAFEETLGKVSRTMSRLKQTRHDLAGPALLVKKYRSTSLEKFLKLYGGMPTSSYAEFTNTGRTDPERLRFDGCTVEAFTLFSCNSYAPQLQLCASSFCGATTFSSLCIGSPQAEQKTQALYDSFVNELLTLDSSHKRSTLGVNC